MTVLVKIFISLGILIADIVLQLILQKTIDRYVVRYGIGQKRNIAMHKVKTTLFHFLAAFALVIIWGVDLQNAWVSIAGFLGLVAIGFFAVWSVLSNLFAGFLLLFTRPFQVDDTIEFLPDGIKGKVKDINSFFIILTDEEGHAINIPNNMVYQKIVRRLKNSSPSG
jgi:MscS family membrane protein